MDYLFDRIEKWYRLRAKEQTYWIAYSGGMDSHVLLHICAEFRKHYPISLKAIHIHHGLSSHADRWVEHCHKVCAELDIQLICKRVSVTNPIKQNIEARARTKRYAAIASLLQANDCLLTAHHQEDQAETVLIQLLRGSGPSGLAAMPIVKSLGLGEHIRPFLDVSRDHLMQYAHQHQLQWIEDDSNQDTALTRNFLRQNIFPLLKKRWPSVSETFSRVARHCAELHSISDLVVMPDLEFVKNKEIKYFPHHTLSLSRLMQLSLSRQRQVLRAWCKELNFPLPSDIKMQQIQHYFLTANQDKCPHISWGHVELRRYQDDLYLLSCVAPHDVRKIYEWNIKTPLILPNLGILHATLMEGRGLLSAKVQKLTVRFRQGGERCLLPGRKHHHDLKKLFQQWGIPPWQRTRIPLLYDDNTLVAVIGYFLHADYVASAEEGYLCALL